MLASLRAQYKALLEQGVISPPQCRSQAVVCVSTPRMYPRSGYFLVKNISKYILQIRQFSSYRTKGKSSRETYLSKEKVDTPLKIALFQTRKYQLRGYILGVLTHTTAWDRHWI